jgi:acetyl esterase/lipase
VAVTGGSAGGHLTAMLALTAGDPAYQEGIEHADTSVQAAVPLYGVYDWTNRTGAMDPRFLSWILEPWVVKRFVDEAPEVFSQGSPIDQVRADAPPFLVIHGDRDTLAPVEDARLFVERLGGVSEAPVLYCELHGAQHAFDTFGSVRTRRTVKAVSRFLNDIHAQHRAGVAPSAMDAHPEQMPDKTVDIDDAGDVAEARSS